MTAIRTIADQAIQETVTRTLARYPQHEARIRRAAQLLEIDAVRFLGGDRYSVRSQTNATRTYLVTLSESGAASCQCPDYQYRQRDCAHCWAAYCHQVAAVRYAVLVERMAQAQRPEEWVPEEAKRLMFARWLFVRGMITEGAV